VELFDPGGPPLVLLHKPLSVPPGLALQLISREFASLSMHVREPGHIVGGGGWLAEELEALHSAYVSRTTFPQPFAAAHAKYVLE
jgi:hypothetical protein